MTFRQRTLAMVIATLAGLAAPTVLWQSSLSAQHLISQAETDAEDDFQDAFALIQEGIGLISNGELQDAVNAFNESLTISREIGDRQLEGIALVARGKALFELGEADSARTSLQDGLAIAQSLGDPELEALAEGVLAELE